MGYTRYLNFFQVSRVVLHAGKACILQQKSGSVIVSWTTLGRHIAYIFEQKLWCILAWIKVNSVTSPEGKRSHRKPKHEFLQLYQCLSPLRSICEILQIPGAKLHWEYTWILWFPSNKFPNMKVVLKNPNIETHISQKTRFYIKNLVFQFLSKK